MYAGMQARALASGLIAAGTCTCNEEISFDLETEVEEAIVEASSTAFQEACASTIANYLNAHRAASILTLRG